VALPHLDNSVELYIFPNPVIEKLNLIMPIKLINGTLTINNRLGQQIYQGSILGINTQIDVSSYTNGIYFIKYTKGSIMHYSKIIKIDS
jgi:hypothetical protein